ncbi:MAG: hypothetical protein AAB296_03530, partial [Candidatus Desantisbacteria bacterium]
DAGEPVKINFGTHETITTIMVTADGTFSVTFRVDTQGWGTKGITATTIHEQNKDKNKAGEHTTFLIEGAYIILVSPITGVVGTEVTVKGVGFDAGDIVCIDFGTHKTITTTMAQPDGTFSVTFLISTQTVCTKVITASTTHETKATSTFDIFSDIIYFALPEGPVGTIVTIEGTGYSSGTVQIDFGTYETITSTTSNESGTFSCTFQINNQEIGNKVVTAFDTIFGRLDTTVFKIKPIITVLTPTQGQVDQEVTVQGTGYKGSETIYIHFGTDQTITTTTVTTNGTFSATFAVSQQPSGPTVITAFTVEDLPESLATTTFVIKVKISDITPLQGQVGDIITITGEGATAGQPVRIGFGSCMTITTTIASSKGTFSTTFIINTQFYGSTVVTATDTNTSEYDTAELKILPEIIGLAPLSGNVGTVVSVWGTGYDYQQQVGIAFGTNPTITTTISGTNGTFSATFVVDSQPRYKRTITATGIYGQFHTIVFNILVDIHLLAPISGIVGTLVTVEGRGYEISELIEVSFGTHQTITTTIASGDGTFSATFLVDTQVHGNQWITARGINEAWYDTTVFVVRSSITFISPQSGPIGSIVTIEGAGYASSTTSLLTWVKIDLTGINTNVIQNILTSVPAGINGTFSRTFTVPAMPGSVSTVKA